MTSMLSRCSLRGGEQRQVAQLGQHPAQFRLKNDQHREGEKRRERAEQPAQHLQFQNGRHQRQRQQHDDEADDHRPAARAAHELENKINQHREDENFQRGPPQILDVNRVRHQFFFRASKASAMRTAWTVSATSCARMICAPSATARVAHASEAGKRSFRVRAKQFSDERFARNAQQQRPPQFCKTPQVRKQLQIVFQRLAKADAGIEHDLFR